jgi:hypothetical protein
MGSKDFVVSLIYRCGNPDYSRGTARAFGLEVNAVSF